MKTFSPDIFKLSIWDQVTRTLFKINLNFATRNNENRKKWVILLRMHQRKTKIWSFHVVALHITHVKKINSRRYNTFAGATNTLNAPHIRLQSSSNGEAKNSSFALLFRQNLKQNVVCMSFIGVSVFHREHIYLQTMILLFKFSNPYAKYLFQLANKFLVGT